MVDFCTDLVGPSFIRGAVKQSTISLFVFLLFGKAP